MNRPNLLWVCTDQQRFDTLGCYGNPFVHTPHLDGLAREGVLFERAFAQSPVCAPSRASFLTGRYPRTTRCRQNGQALPEEETLVTERLSQAGYTGGLAGKLHLAPCHPSVCSGTEPRRADGYDQFHWAHDPDPLWPTNEYRQWLRAQGVGDEAWTPFEGSDYVSCGPPVEQHHTTWCTERAIDFIRGQADFEQPWLFSVNLFDPHHKFDPPRAALERYADRLSDIPLPNYEPGELADKPVWQQVDHEGAYGGRAGFSYDAMTDEDHRWIRAAYWAMVDVIDRQVGRLLEALEATGQREDTLVVFMSDHGEMLGDHGIYLKGPHFYEPAVRVPLLMSGPGVRDGQRIEEMVEFIDLAPTLLEAAGLEPSPAMQGRSRWPLLTSETSDDAHRDDVYCEFYNANFDYDPPAYATMLRTERHKLVAAHGRDTGELYDLQDDPGETTNRWSDPAYADVRHNLLLRLTDRMAFTADPMPEREAPW